MTNPTDVTKKGAKMHNSFLPGHEESNCRVTNPTDVTKKGAKMHNSFLPEWEFMNTILPKDSSLLHYAIHSSFFWRIFVYCMVFSDSSFLQQRGGGAGRESADHRGADRFDIRKTTLY
jgi:hypothetical protein